ncbi:hypothetical protein BJY52DRAFT_1215669 [Lactarius psammicola]|nr:hypothetical protein BJY52DRAFT_1215669 [Lactarius psammicola]
MHARFEADQCLGLGCGGDDGARERRGARSATVVLGDVRNVDAAHPLCAQYVQDQVSDLQLPPTVDADAPRYKRDCRRKIAYFRSQPAMRLILDARCDVSVRRGWVLGDSFVAIVRLRPEILRKRSMIKFGGEDALDYGGVSSEWIFLLSHEMFNPSYGLFENSAHDNYILRINPELPSSMTATDPLQCNGGARNASWLRNTTFTMALQPPLTLKVCVSIPQSGHKLFPFSRSLDI